MIASPFRGTFLLRYLAVSVVVGLIATVLGVPLSAAAATSTVSVAKAWTEGMTNPMGIDNTQPVLSWNLSAASNGATQTAYEIRASSTQAGVTAGTSTLWSTGKVSGGALAATWAGQALASRSAVFWQVRAWDQSDTVSDWSSIYTFEVGLLNSTDWSAKWIADPGTASTGVTVTFPSVSARYVRIDISKLGLPLATNSSEFFVQLAEIQVKNGASGANLASSATLTSSSSLEGYGWGLNNLKDGVNDTNSSARGWTSWPASSTQTPSSSTWVQLDLGAATTVDRVVLYPRTDATATGGVTASFPTDFTIGTATSAPGGDPSATVVASESAVTAPTYSSTGTAYAITPPSAVTARYVTLAVPTVGIAESGSRFFVQFAEIQVLDAGGTNLAAGKPVTVSSDLRDWGWAKEYLVDGVTNTNGSSHGWTSDPVASSATLPQTAIVTIDLGSDKTVSKVNLWPRTDINNAGKTVSFPTTYTLRVNRDTVFSLAKTVVNQPAPAAPSAATSTALPLMASDFTTSAGKTVSKARLYVSGLGIYQASLNGTKVGDDVLAPGYTDWTKKVEYATYDVTNKLTSGSNALGIQLGWGAAYIPDTPNRYEKYGADISRPKAIAQLEITYTDGTTSTVGTDANWRATYGPTTLSNWFGGEDYDATRVIANWDKAGTDRSTWRAAALSSGTPPALVAPGAPALRVTDTLAAAAPTTPATGVSVYKFPVNFAGWEQVTFTAPVGTTLQFWPGERLDSGGRVNQDAIGGPVYDSVVGNGSSITWHPTFRYNGFQYLEVRGIVSGVTISNVQGLVVRAANEQVGSFSSSNSTLNGVHTLVDRAIQSNMYSTLTDCPHREKLGWLEETHLVFGAIMRNYDVSAYARSIVKKIADSQLSNDLVPSIAPEYVVFGGGFRDDPNWGGALVLMPWAMYQNYGDTQTLSTYYTQMQKYISYLDTKRSTTAAYDDTLQYDSGLGDWAEQGVSTDRNLAATFGYYRAVDAMAGIATALGKTSDATSYRAQANRIAADTQTRWYDATNKTVSNSTQAALAFALDINAVPSADRATVAGKLASAITSNGKRLTVGEIALPSVYRVLSKYGYDQLIFDSTTQTTSPSYGYFVAQGAGSLPEYWDMNGSLNHFMLGAVDEWFSSRVAGIQQSATSVAFKDIVVKPSVVGGMTNAQASYRTKYGTVSSSWTVTSGKVNLIVTVPVGSTATVNVPLLANSASAVPVHDAAATYTGAMTLEDGNYASFTVGSGTWTFGPGLQ